MAVAASPRVPSSNGSGYSPINTDILSRDVCGCIGCEEGDRCSDLPDCAVALQRNAFPEFRLFRKAVDESRQHVVHADVVWRITVRIQFGKGCKTSAKHSGGRESRIGLEGGESRDVYDHSRLLS